jgi:hypothetical protein
MHYVRVDCTNKTTMLTNAKSHSRFNQMRQRVIELGEYKIVHETDMYNVSRHHGDNACMRQYFFLPMSPLQ